MRLAANIMAFVLSMVFYPLFVPTYGVALFCLTTQCPMGWAWIAILGTLVFTCILPLTSIGILIKAGKVKDLQIANAAERTMPYLYSTIGFAFWSYLMGHVLEAPLFLTVVCIGATVAIGGITLINRRWKISAHLTGVGGLVGGIFSYYIAINSTPEWHLILTLMLFSIVMMFARLRLNAHTSAQVAAGWIWGLFCTCVPNCIIAYVG